VTLFIQVTEACARAAGEHAQNEQLARIRERVLESQALTGFADLLPGPYLKRSLGGEYYRLLARRYPVGDDEVVLFLDVFPRSRLQYEGTWRLAIDAPWSLEGS
jgi:hypothetical protein